MNIQELCSVIPKQIIHGDEAPQMLRMSMEATSKVYKTAQLYFAESDEQNEMIWKAIEDKISDLTSKEILWKGIYGEAPDIVTFWYFMHGLLIIRGLDDKWSIMCARITKKKWQKFATMNKTQA